MTPSTTLALVSALCACAGLDLEDTTKQFADAHKDRFNGFGRGNEGANDDANEKLPPLALLGGNYALSRGFGEEPEAD